MSYQCSLHSHSLIHLSIISPCIFQLHYILKLHMLNLENARIKITVQHLSNQEHEAVHSSYLKPDP